VRPKIILDGKVCSANSYYSNSREALAGFALRNGISGTIVDLGCASGGMGSALRRSNSVDRVVGVEVSNAATTAAEVLDHVVHGSLEHDHVWNDLPASFDSLVCADILEHLTHPELILERAVNRLSTNGLAIFSFPNVAYYRVLKDLLLHDRWQYTDCGVLDRTHLRFFSISSASALVEGAGLRVVSSSVPLASRAAKVGRLAPVALRFLAAQVYIAARKI